jgi:hypothetical protein
LFLSAQPPSFVSLLGISIHRFDSGSLTTMVVLSCHAKTYLMVVAHDAIPSHHSSLLASWPEVRGHALTMVLSFLREPSKRRCSEWGVVHRQAALHPPVLESMSHLFLTMTDSDAKIAARITNQGMLRTEFIPPGPDDYWSVNGHDKLTH